MTEKIEVFAQKQGDHSTGLLRRGGVGDKSHYGGCGCVMKQLGRGSVWIIMNYMELRGRQS